VPIDQQKEAGQGRQRQLQDEVGQVRCQTHDHCGRPRSYTVHPTPGLGLERVWTANQRLDRRPPADVVQEGAHGDPAFGEAVPDGDALLNGLGHNERERRHEHQDHPEHDHGGGHSRGDVMAREPL
jgi:hypothetical protein